MGEDRPLSGGAMVWLVARREVDQRVRARSFLVGTGFLVVAILAVGLISRLASDDGPGTIELGLVLDRSEAVVATFEASAALAEREVEITFSNDTVSARTALDDGDVGVVADPLQGEVLFSGDIDATVLAIIQQAWTQISIEERLSEAGLDAEEVEAALTVAPLTASSVDGDDEPPGLGVLTGTLSAILLFISLQTFGTYVLTGVVEEKSSAVVEVLLVRARADQLLAGKVIGIGIAALAQFAAAVASGVAALAISGVDVPGEIWTAVPMMLLWFLGGFTLYATLFALAGSLVSRQEDAQAAAAPIGYGLVAAYLLVFIFGYQAESTASRILSMVPPIAPLLMPVRTSVGAATALEVAVALVGLLVTTVIAWKLASRIYEQVLLRRGARISWREALGLLRP